MKTGRIALLLVLGLILFTSCNSDDDNETEFESTGMISGFDMTLCACCGGWIIDIDGEKSENRFTELPQNINLETVKFPISVKLNWTESNEYCGKGITIESLELIE